MFPHFSFLINRKNVLRKHTHAQRFDLSLKTRQIKANFARTFIVALFTITPTENSQGVHSWHICRMEHYGISNAAYVCKCSLCAKLFLVASSNFLHHHSDRLLLWFGEALFFTHSSKNYAEWLKLFMLFLKVTNPQIPESLPCGELTLELKQRSYDQFSFSPKVVASFS